MLDDFIAEDQVERIIRKGQPLARPLGDPGRGGDRLDSPFALDFQAEPLLAVGADRLQVGAQAAAVIEDTAV